MKGMVLKDLYIMKSQGKIMGLIILFYAVLSALRKNYLMSSCVFLFVAIMPMTSMAYDEHFKWDSYALATPVGRTNIVKAKYLFHLILLAAAFLLEVVLMCVVLLTQEVPRTGDMLRFVAGSAFIAAFYQSIMIPLVFKLGSEKSRFVLIAIILIPFIAGVLYSRSSLPRPSAASIDRLSKMASSPLLAAAVPVAMALIYTVSYFISLRIYRKKEF